MKTFFNTSDSKAFSSNSTFSLNDLKNGESALIGQIQSNCNGPVRRRLLDLGFVPGTRVKKLGQGLFDGPTRFGIRGNVIALRADQSSQISAISA